MRIPLSWLKEFVKITLSPKELAERITMHSFEVGSINQVDGETVFDIDILPNRPDCMSILGMAREIGAILHQKTKIPKVYKVDEEKETTVNKIKIEVKDHNLCPRYMARIIEDVTIKSSPAWLKKRLELCGIRSINNVVDVTNYVLLELGQPLHAFDYEKLSGNKIIVKCASKGEKFKALDDKEYELNEKVLCIADQEKKVAIAGVIGGENSQVTDQTKTIVLESAFFNPSSINETAKKIVRTESSIRFEKGVDWEGVEKALDLAAQIIKELAGGKVLKGKIDVSGGRRAAGNGQIKLRTEKINKILGQQISKQEIKKILASLGFIIKESKNEVFSVKVPSFRVQDIIREIDLIEEIARIYGYDKIKPSLPTVKPRIFKQSGFIEEKIRQILTGYGLNEIITLSVTSPKKLEKLGFAGDDYRLRFCEISNPLSDEISILRTTLLTGIIGTLQTNVRRQTLDIHVFEIGRIFIDKGKEVPEEHLMLAGAMTGKFLEGLINNVNFSVVEANFYILKEIISELLSALGQKDFSFKAVQNDLFHLGQSAKIILPNEANEANKANEANPFATFGLLHPRLQSLYDFPNKVYLFEIDLSSLLILKPTMKTFTALPRFPSSIRDLSILVSKEISWKGIEETIKNTNIEILEAINLFDCYEGEGIPQGQKSLAFHLIYRVCDRTLTDEEVNSAHQKIIEALQGSLSVKIR